MARLGRFFRSASVGIVATAADLLTLVVLIEAFGVSVRMANAPSLVVGVCVQYFGNKHFAFRDRSPTTAKKVGLFGLVEIGTFVLNGLAYDVLVTTIGMRYEYARLVGTFVVYVAFSYPLWARVFRAPAASAAHQLDDAVKPGLRQAHEGRPGDPREQPIG